MARVPLDYEVRDRPGSVVPGIRLYVYDRGTTNEASVYDDDTAGSVIDQPLLSDVEGRYPDSWVGAGSYDRYSPDDAVQPTQPWEAVLGIESGDVAIFRERTFDSRFYEDLVVGNDWSAAIEAAVAAAVAAGGGKVLAPTGEVEAAGIVGASGVTLAGFGQGITTLTLPDGADDDVIRADGETEFVVEDMTIDGNKTNQTSQSINDDNVTALTRGIGLLDCTRSGVRNAYIHDTNYTGLLVYDGADNFADRVTVVDPGRVPSWGQGIDFQSSLRFRGTDLTTFGGVNSGVCTSGGSAGDGGVLNAIHASGCDLSPISINTTNCQLDNFYGADSTDSGAAGLTVGHVGAAISDASGIQASNGHLTGNAIGVSIAQCFDGEFTNVKSIDNDKHNLNVFGDQVGRLKFFGGGSDGTTLTGGSSGIGVILTSSGDADAIGDIEFHGYDVRNSSGKGVQNAGLRGVRWYGGVVEDNTGIGFSTVDNTTLAGDNLCLGTVFRDTRAGGARTQTHPFTSTATGGRNFVFLYACANHVTSDLPSLASATDIALGVTAGDKIRLHGPGGVVEYMQAGTVDSLGQFLGSLNGAAAPPYAFAGRTNQGMFSLGGSTVGFSAGGVEQARFDGTRWTIQRELEIEGALNHDGTMVGFYGTAPVAKQTGVAVDAAGIHAALVALGLIAA